MKTYLIPFALMLFAFSVPPKVVGQSAVITSGDLPACPADGPNKVVTWTASLSNIGDYKVVGCYAPVYGQLSPTTFYSPSEGQSERPRLSGGSETGRVPLSQDGVELEGVLVWFEYGAWVKYNNLWYWFSQGQLCNWYWIPYVGGTCFSGGTHLRTPDGSKPIEQFVVGDEILSSPRDNFTAKPSIQRIKQVKVNIAKLLKLAIDGHELLTTPEHSFYMKDKGWVAAASLSVGDLLRGDAERWCAVESIAAGADSVVYNVVVDGKSGYFVGHTKWKFSLWASDVCCNPENSLELGPQIDGRILQVTNYGPKNLQLSVRQDLR